jgi:hypothetical protein
MPLDAGSAIRAVATIVASIVSIVRVEFSKREAHTFHRQGRANLADPRIHALDKALDSRAMLVPVLTLRPWLR